MQSFTANIDTFFHADEFNVLRQKIASLQLDTIDSVSFVSLEDDFSINFVKKMSGNILCNGVVKDLNGNFLTFNFESPITELGTFAKLIENTVHF